METIIPFFLFSIQIDILIWCASGHGGDNCDRPCKANNRYHQLCDTDGNIGCERGMDFNYVKKESCLS